MGRLPNVSENEKQHRRILSGPSEEEDNDSSTRPVVPPVRKISNDNNNNNNNNKYKAFRKPNNHRQSESDRDDASSIGSSSLLHDICYYSSSQLPQRTQSSSSSQTKFASAPYAEQPHPLLRGRSSFSKNNHSKSSKSEAGLQQYESSGFFTSTSQQSKNTIEISNITSAKTRNSKARSSKSYAWHSSEKGRIQETAEDDRDGEYHQDDYVSQQVSTQTPMHTQSQTTQENANEISEFSGSSNNNKSGRTAAAITQTVSEATFAATSRISIPTPPQLRQNRNMTNPGAFRINGVCASAISSSGNRRTDYDCDDSFTETYSLVFSPPPPVAGLQPYHNNFNSSANEFLVEATLVHDESSSSHIRDLEMPTLPLEGDPNARAYLDNDNDGVMKIDLVEARRLKRYSKRTLCGYCFLLLLAIIGLIVGVVMGKNMDTYLPRPGETETNTDNTNVITTPTTDDAFTSTKSPVTIEPTQPQPRFEETLPEDILHAIQNYPLSPQAKAYNWLLTDIEMHNQQQLFFDDNSTTANRKIQPYSNHRKLQRFVLAVFYFTLHGSNWKKGSNTWLSHDHHECDWYTDESTERICNNHDYDDNDNNNNEQYYEIIHLFSSNMTGIIPIRELSLLSKSLIKIDLSDNHIHGSILSTYNNRHDDISVDTHYISQLTNLRHIDFFNNFLTGEIPTELGSLTELKYLDLDNNFLSGTVPWDSFNDLNKLRIVSFAQNLLTGTLFNNKNENDNNSNHDSFWGKSINYLSFENNTLTGSIPNEIQYMTSLSILDLSRNKLSGAIPSEIGILSNTMTHLYLENNSLNGTLPTELGLLTKLQTLWIHGNPKLSGTVPKQVCDLLVEGQGKLNELIVDCEYLDCSTCAARNNGTNACHCHYY